jgi:LuxR family quorum sensing-dependent transcriptional regulator
VLDTIDALQRAPSALKVKEVMRRSTEQYGLHAFLCSAMPRPGGRTANPILLDEWPHEWQARYRERRYYLRDPMLFELFMSPKPYVWGEILKRRRIAPADRRIVTDAAAWGMREGFVVPLQSEGDLFALTMAGERPRLDPMAQRELHLIAIYAYGRANEFRGQAPSQRVFLTPRQREALQYAAMGKTDDEIGDLMGVSRHAAHRLIEKAKGKFEVGTRMQAVVEAIRQRLILF